jgi:hypothetical protein
MRQAEVKASLPRGANEANRDGGKLFAGCEWGKPIRKPSSVDDGVNE